MVGTLCGRSLTVCWIVKDGPCGWIGHLTKEIREHAQRVPTLEIKLNLGGAATPPYR